MLYVPTFQAAVGEPLAESRDSFDQLSRLLLYYYRAHMPQKAGDHSLLQAVIVFQQSLTAERVFQPHFSCASTHRLHNQEFMYLHFPRIGK